MDLPMAVKERRGLTRKGDHAFLAERIKRILDFLEKFWKNFSWRENEFIGCPPQKHQMLMAAMRRNSIFCIQLEKNKKTKKTWKNAWQKWHCRVLLMSTFERALWRDIEVVITRRSWKPFVRKGAWVRIPLSPLTVLRSQRDEFLVQN